MNLHYHLIALLGFVWTSLLPMYGYANGTAFDTGITTTVDKEKPRKKKASKNGSGPTTRMSPLQRKWKDFWLSTSNIGLVTTRAVYSGGAIFEVILLILLLLAVPSLFVLGVVTGGIGWFIAGAVLTALWLFFAYFTVLLKVFYIYGYGSGIFAVLAVTFIAFFIWAILATLPTLLIFSAILGGLALIGLLIYLINEILYQMGYN